MHDNHSEDVDTLNWWVRENIYYVLAWMVLIARDSKRRPLPVPVRLMVLYPLPTTQSKVGDLEGHLGSTLLIRIKRAHSSAASLF